MDKEVEQQNLEAARVTPEEIAELLYHESDKKRSPLDLVIGFLFIIISVMIAILIAWWVV